MICQAQWDEDSKQDLVPPSPALPRHQPLDPPQAAGRASVNSLRLAGQASVHTLRATAPLEEASIGVPDVPRRRPWSLQHADSSAREMNLGTSFSPGLGWMCSQPWCLVRISRRGCSQLTTRMSQDAENGGSRVEEPLIGRRDPRQRDSLQIAQLEK